MIHQAFCVEKKKSLGLIIHTTKPGMQNQNHERQQKVVHYSTLKDITQKKETVMKHKKQSITFNRSKWNCSIFKTQDKEQYVSIDQVNNNKQNNYEYELIHVANIPKQDNFQFEIIHATNISVQPTKISNVQLIGYFFNIPKDKKYTIILHISA